MTPTVCTNTCRAGGFKYAGLQYGRQVCPALLLSHPTRLLEW